MSWDLMCSISPPVGIELCSQLMELARLQGHWMVNQRPGLLPLSKWKCVTATRTSIWYVLAVSVSLVNQHAILFRISYISMF